MEDLEAKLKQLPLRGPSAGLDARVHAAIPEQTPGQPLDQACLGQPRPMERKEEQVRSSIFARIPPVLKIAAGFLAAAILIGTGWAAEKVYLKLTKLVVRLEDFDGRTSEWSLTLPDGSIEKMQTCLSVGGKAIDVSSDPQQRQAAVAAAKQEHEEVKRLIAAKKYEFREEFKWLDGCPRYTYKFKLADGKAIEQDFGVRLEDVASWDDYLRREKEANVRHHAEINKAIKAGRFRLIDVSTFLEQLCRDVKSGRKLRVLRDEPGDGRQLAFLTPDGASQEVETWQEHLQAIRDGRRELLGLDIRGRHYKYELIFDDGSKVVWDYFSTTPLKELADPKEWSLTAPGHK